MFKISIAIIVVASCTLGAWAECYGKNHNQTFGYRRFGDTLLYTERIIEASSWLSRVTRDVVYPKPGDLLGVITYIEVTDPFNDGNGACAYTANGGVGTREVTLHLKSERGYGIDTIVKIFGMLQGPRH